jgi:Domain of unknown function (DUF4397)
MRDMRTAVRAVIVAFVAVGLMATTAVAGQRSESQTRWHRPANLTLVHGIDGAHGFPVDISVWKLGGGVQHFDDVTYGTIAGPLEVRAGLYRVAIRAAGAPRFSTPLLKKWVWLYPGANKSVVAHLTADGSPTMSTYRNDVSNAEAGARVTVRHDAAVGPVNVYANGGKVISHLANPHQAVLEIPATTLTIKVEVAGGPTVFDADVAFAEDTNTIIYATLDADGNFNPLLQVLPTA